MQRLSSHWRRPSGDCCEIADVAFSWAPPLVLSFAYNGQLEFDAAGADLRGWPNMLMHMGCFNFEEVMLGCEEVL